MFLCCLILLAAQIAATAVLVGWIGRCKDVLKDFVKVEIRGAAAAHSIKIGDTNSLLMQIRDAASANDEAVFEQLDAVLNKLDKLTAEDFASEGKKPEFKLDDSKMQEAISNLMGYDPFERKRKDG
jgi:hypothetical protein